MLVYTEGIIVGNDGMKKKEEKNNVLLLQIVLLKK
jgi:hypothetical protein